MKKFTLVTLWLAMAFIVLEFILAIPYYKLMLKNDLRADYSTIINVAKTALSLLIQLAVLILGILAVASTDKNARDRNYAIFRFIYVAGTVMTYPLLIYSRILYAKYIYATGWLTLSTTLQDIVGTTLVIFLIINKPEKQVPKVNLQNYDMVAFTSGGHRFLHYILDSLFLLPMTLAMFQWLLLREGSSLLIQLLITASYLLYYFFSEAVFGQTFGKMITRSCVVSDSVELTTGRFFLRSLARLIPFDAISFLVGAKWHDRASSTAVVYVNSWEKVFVEVPEAAATTA